MLVSFTSRYVLRSPIVSVFLLYPARKEYADALAYRWHQRRFSWQPGLVGFYRQGGRYGLIFGVPNLEDDIRAEHNAPQLHALMCRMDAAQRSVGAARKVFAGILPSMFSRNGIENEHLADQRYLTARAVLQALDQVIDQHGLGKDVPILVLGGRGYSVDSPAARHFRELRVDRIWEGTSEIQRLIIAGGLFKRGSAPYLGWE